MPYKTNEDLPNSIRRKLPKHAQDIFRATFNNSYEEYKDPSKRRKRQTPRHVVAYKVAWSAVKTKYHKNEATGKWAEN
jgi:cation transport regulator